MARGVREVVQGTWVLDSEALSQVLLAQPKPLARLETARRKGTAVVVSAMTVPEAFHEKVPWDWLRYVLSRVAVAPVTEEIGLKATELLGEYRLHGHKYAIDAVVAATALLRPGPVAVLTSDVDDLRRFCQADKRITVVQV